MIKINKRNEPTSWTLYRKTPGAKYAASSDLRESLLKEQGYICAYCMRSIPVSKKDQNEADSSKIEHIKSRTTNPHLQLNYDNMIICCPGNINGLAHCDKSKESNEISLSPLDINLQPTLSYGTNKGEIKSSNSTWMREINEILCLNNQMLQHNRIQTLSGIRTILEQKRWKKAIIEEKLKEWSSFDRHGKFKPYCGIVIWYLEKKLRQM